MSNKNAASPAEGSSAEESVVRKSKARRAKAPIIALDQPGRLRIANLMALLSISHQTLYTRIRNGEVPQPDGHDGRRPFWRTSTISAYLNKAMP